MGGSYNIWGYRIYRKKMLGTVLLILALSLVTFSGMLFFFTMNWADDLVQQAQNRFLTGERRLANLQDWASDYVSSIYENQQLMLDIQALFEASDASDYLQRRRVNSLENRERIVYFPANLRRFLRTRYMRMAGVTLNSDSGVKALWLSESYEEVMLSFETAFLGQAEGWDTPGDLIAFSSPVRDPAHVNLIMGTMDFWVDSEDIYEETYETDSRWAVLDEVGNVLCGSPAEDRQDEWLTAAAQQEAQSGWLSGKRLNPVLFIHFESSQCSYSFVAVQDVVSLIADNFNTVLTLLLALVFVDVGALAIIYAGVRTDARFLTYILTMLSAMEERRFESAQELALPAQHRENEYGMIAVALKEMALKLQGYIETEYVLKLKEKETEMRALQHQINPHFLYNTLETLRSKALTRGDRDTAEAIAMLGTLYRARMHRKESITLKEEFELLEMYLQIMALRFGDQFVYQIGLEEAVWDVETVNFWLQPLAENFFTHGFNRESEYNLLIVSGTACQDGVLIEVIDNGTGAKEEELAEIRRNMYEGNDDPEADIGLRNVYMRLHYFYREGFEMKLDNNAEGGFRVSIHIPGKAGKKDVYIDDRG